MINVRVSLLKDIFVILSSLLDREKLSFSKGVTYPKLAFSSRQNPQSFPGFLQMNTAKSGLEFCNTKLRFGAESVLNLKLIGISAEALRALCWASEWWFSVQLQCFSQRMGKTEEEREKSEQGCPLWILS